MVYHALQEGAVCELLFFNGKVISVDPPAFVELAVASCPPNVKGNTASGAAAVLRTLLRGPRFEGVPAGWQREGEGQEG